MKERDEGGKKNDHMWGRHNSNEKQKVFERERERERKECSTGGKIKM